MIALFTLWMLAATPDAGEELPPPEPAAQKPARKKTFERLEVHAQNSVHHFTEKYSSLRGNIRAVRGPTTLTCDKGMVYYDKNGDPARVVCTGHVKIVDGDRWGRGEKADLDNVRNLLVVTGNPEAGDGPHYITAEKVIFHIDEDVIEAENGTTTIDPSKRKPGPVAP